MVAISLTSRVKFWAKTFTFHYDLSEQKTKKTKDLATYESGAEFAARLINMLNPELGVKVRIEDLKSGLRKYGYQESKDTRVFDIAFANDIYARYSTYLTTNLMEKFAFDATAIIYETCGVLIGNSISLGGIRSELIGEYGALYSAVRTVEKLDAENFRTHTKLLKEEATQDISSASQKSLERFYEVIGDAIEKEKGSFLEAVDKRKAEEIASIEKEKEELLSRFEQEAETTLNNKIEALKTDLILTDAIDMWEKKAKAHTIAYWSAASVFAVMIVAPIIFAIGTAEYLKAGIDYVFPATDNVAFGRLIIVTAPLLGYAWMLRLVSRYLNQNLTLLHDADQRRVMARTFVHLVAEGAASNEQDRTTILTALFRPMPGTGTEDDQPPHVIGMIKKEILPDGKR